MFMLDRYINVWIGKEQTVIKLQYSRTSRDFVHFRKLAALRTCGVNLVLYPLIYRVSQEECARLREGVPI